VPCSYFEGNHIPLTKRKVCSFDFSIISNIHQNFILTVSYVRQPFLTYMVVIHAGLFLNEYKQQVNVLSFSSLSFSFHNLRLHFSYRRYKNMVIKK